MIKELSNDQQRTYDEVFQHPISSNLERRDVRHLFEALGDVTDEHNGNLKIDRNGHTLVLHPVHDSHPAGFDEVMQIRHFLEASNPLEIEHKTDAVKLLVVVEHRQASVYRTESAGSIPEKIVPHPTHANPRHVHNAQEHGGRQSRPVGPSYYKAIAENLGGADEILVFGTGEGARTAIDGLKSELMTNHKELYGRLVGEVVVGGRHISEEQILEKAREFYQTRTEHEKNREIPHIDAE